MAVRKEIARTGWREAWGILLVTVALLFLLSLFSYAPGDIPLLKSPPNRPAENFIGPVGAWTAFFFFMALGIGAYLLPAGLMIIGLLLIFKREGRVWPKAVWLTVMLLALLCIFDLQPGAWEGVVEKLNTCGPGGVVGSFLTDEMLVRWLGTVGTGIIAASLLAISLILFIEIHPLQIAHAIGVLAVALFKKVDEKIAEHRDERSQIEREQRKVEKQRRRLEDVMREQEQEKAEREAAVQKPAIRPAVIITPGRGARAVPEPEIPEVEEEVEELPPPPKKERPKPVRAPEPVNPEPLFSQTNSAFKLPPVSMLDPLPPEKDREIRGDFQASAVVLKETFAEFGIEVDVTNVERGPVVTRYELLPAPGVRLEKIVALGNNIALAMKAESVRVQAPIPGKGVVGIEVPNSKTTVVFLRELIESATWQSGKAALPLAIGKDVGGHEIVADLAEMPHMLIAGATGSGKTVCMNSILTGLLMSRTPDELRLMLIDPKIVEFSTYNHLPHLVVPVITDPKKVSIGLRWAINEMEKRYKLFAKVGVRNIKSYNTRPILKQTELFEGAPGEAEKPSDEPPDRLPYIVIVVDELADLMLVAQAEIETGIARLAQLSRAVGIHMILATQRPSVNVITGTIKANFPARISFQVAQKVDSRTILDANGADKLLGKGDMLFLPPGSGKLTRAQGTMTTDAEMRRIVDFIKKQGQPQYENTIKDKMDSNAPDLPDMGEDDLLDSAIEIIRQTKRASTSSLQRRLRIGYTRAARLMDLLEQRGVVGPPCGSDPREILIDLDGEIPQNPTDETEV
ncbi:MAG TPA: DNA translocase FtsK [Kiritimatiellia bacterium]|nr:DNA translocase FtsK [Kiritimatiellia bacterium]